MSFIDQDKKSPPPPDDEHPFYIEVADSVRHWMGSGSSFVTVIDPNAQFRVMDFSDPYAEVKPINTITLTISRAMSRDEHGRVWTWLVAQDDKGRYVTTEAERY